MRWALAGLVAVAGLAGALCVPGWQRGRRVQADFDALLREHPGVRVESIRDLDRAEVQKLDQSRGVSLVLRTAATDMAELVRFGDALSSHPALSRAFPVMLIYTEMKVERSASGDYTETTATAVANLAGNDRWVSLRR